MWGRFPTCRKKPARWKRAPQGNRDGLLLLDRLLDGLDEKGPLVLLGGELGGVLLRFLLAGVVEGRDALVRVVVHAPDDAHPDDLAGAAALRLGRLGGGLLFLGRWLDDNLFLLLVAVRLAFLVLL